MGKYPSGKVPDLTGRTFGKLTVTGPAGKIGRTLAWRCRCECGNETVVKGYDLTSGHTRSCGCLVRDAGRAKRMDLTGNAYGKLTVLGPAENVGKNTAWRCRCECGSEVTVATRNLTSGTTRSCGCLRGHWTRTKMDLTGDTYGRLTVLDRAEDIDGTPAWRCRCECGSETVVRQRDLRSGHTRSCGCGQGKERLDLTGRTFGRLTVLGPAEDVGGKTAWRCRCGCGGEVTVRTSGLTSGRTRSCGCLAREASRARRLDLTGQTFGRLTVLGPAEDMGRYTAWRCRCECGTEVTVRSNSLTAGKTRSCGCLARDAGRGRKLDLTGQTFGRLTVLGPAENVGRYTAWKCRCECGKETVVRTSDLRTGLTKSCGCLQKESRFGHAAGDADRA